ncbi:MAG: hypothetical protein Q8Q33_06490, partial [Chlamydiota bacterium]|nr:hypothetical protein [Chlamydiota bacterium]
MTAKPCFLNILIFFFALLPQDPSLAVDQIQDAYSYEGNLLENGGFEAGLVLPWGTGKSSQNRPIWWNSSSCQSKITISTKAFKEGKQSLRINNPSPRAPDVFGTVAQSISIKANKRYRLVAWAGSKDVASAGAFSIVVDSAWKIRPISLPAGSVPWTQYDATFSLPTNVADIRILSEDKGFVWFD